MGVAHVFLLTTRACRLWMWHLQSYETEKMEEIFKSIAIERARKGHGIIGPTNPNSMTTPSKPCSIARNPSVSKDREP